MVLDFSCTREYGIGHQEIEVLAEIKRGLACGGSVALSHVDKCC